MRGLKLALPIVGLLAVAAVGPMTTTTANTIAGLVMVVAPIVLKYVHLQGPKMAIFSYVVALATAVAAGFVSGDLTLASFNVQNILVTSTALWAVMQGVFQLFKDNKTFGALLR